MSETFESADDFLADDLIGETSEEMTTADEAPVVQEEGPKKRGWFSMNVFDAMMMLSLIFVTLATLFLFLELLDFGNPLEGFPWRTSEFKVGT